MLLIGDCWMIFAMLIGYVCPHGASILKGCWVTVGGYV